MRHRNAHRKLSRNSSHRRAMLRELKRLVGRRIYVARSVVVVPDELALAIQLLDGRAVSEVRDALMVRLGCQKSKAYCLITAALVRRERRVL